MEGMSIMYWWKPFNESPAFSVTLYTGQYIPRSVVPVTDPCSVPFVPRSNPCQITALSQIDVLIPCIDQAAASILAKIYQMPWSPCRQFSREHQSQPGIPVTCPHGQMTYVCRCCCRRHSAGIVRWQMWWGRQLAQKSLAFCTMASNTNKWLNFTLLNGTFCLGSVVTDHLVIFEFSNKK